MLIFISKPLVEMLTWPSSDLPSAEPVGSAGVVAEPRLAGGERERRQAARGSSFADVMAMVLSCRPE